MVRLITGATLSRYGHTVTPAIEGLRAAMAEIIRFSLKAGNGTAIGSEAQQTINAIP